RHLKMAACLRDVAWSSRRERTVRTVGLPAHDPAQLPFATVRHTWVTLWCLAVRTPPGRPAKIAVCDTPGFTIRPEVNRDVSFSTILSSMSPLKTGGRGASPWPGPCPYRERSLA